MRINESLGTAARGRRALNSPAFPAAKVAVVLALTVVVTVFLMLTGFIGGPAPVDSSSPSYHEGVMYVAANFSASRTENSVCTMSQARRAASPTAWLQGCHDAWAIAAFRTQRSAGLGVP